MAERNCTHYGCRISEHAHFTIGRMVQEARQEAARRAGQPVEPTKE
jgi:hypothetical protein